MVNTTNENGQFNDFGTVKSFRKEKIQVGTYKGFVFVLKTTNGAEIVFGETEAKKLFKNSVLKEVQ